MTKGAACRRFALIAALALPFVAGGCEFISFMAASAEREGSHDVEAKYKGFSLAGITFSTVKVPELSGQGVSAAAFLLFGAAQMIGARRRRFTAA